MSNGRAKAARGSSTRTSGDEGDLGSAFAEALAFHQGGFLADAQTLYRKILLRSPDHVDALHFLGVSEHQAGRLGAAEGLIARALVIDPHSAGAHYNLGNLLLQSKRFDEALASCDRAIALKPGYGEAFNNRGTALFDLRRYDDAVASYDEALVVKPDSADVWCNRGEALLALRRFTEALASHDRALAINPNLAIAWASNLAEVCFESGRAFGERKLFEEAMASYERAIVLKPHFAQAWNNRGVALQSLHRLDEALADYDRAIALRPDDAETLNNRGTALFGLRRYDEAIGSYNQALSIEPDRAAIWCNHGEALFALDRFAEALASHERALAINPDLAAACLDKGLALGALKRFEEALASYERAIVLEPGFAGAWNNRGAALRSLQRFDEALASYDRAIALRPDDAEVLNNRGTALCSLRRYDEAMESYGRALSIRPDFAVGWCNRGEALFLLDRFEEALASHDRALAIDPKLAVSWYGRANVLRTSRLVEAFAACNTALAIEPGFVNALTLLGRCHATRGDTKQAVACYDRALAIKPDDELAIANKIFALDFDKNAGFAEHQAARAFWWQQIGARIFAQSRLHHDNDRNPTRRIVLGYVSSDFRNHSAGFVFRPVLGSHDKTRFEVICYSCSATEDAVTRDFQSVADRWRNASQWSDEQLADRIRADRVDILIDLSGHSAGYRLRMFARKPAPIQVTAWGNATGTGLPTIDYLFSDPVAIPAAVRHMFSEKIYDLPCLLIVDPPTPRLHAPEPPVLSKGHMTYGVFNRIDKISDDAIRVWSRILAADVEARLVIKHYGLDEQSIRSMLLDRFAVCGVSADRIELLGSTSRDEHLAAYGRVDVCLDTFPQNGGVSTWEALHMGVPVVAKLGDSIPHRVSGAILSSIGMTEWVATGDHDYAEIALKFGSVPDRLRTIRHELPARIAMSSGCAPDSYVKAVEEAYRAMWNEYCARET